MIVLLCKKCFYLCLINNINIAMAPLQCIDGQGFIMSFVYMEPVLTTSIKQRILFLLAIYLLVKVNGLWEELFRDSSKWLLLKVNGFLEELSTGSSEGSSGSFCSGTKSAPTWEEGIYPF